MRMCLALAGAVVFAAPPVLAQDEVVVDWAIAAATFLEHRADGSQLPTPRMAARCAGYWVTHGAALTQERFSTEALILFDSELTSPEEASTSALVFSTVARDERRYRTARDEAEGLLDEAIAGDRRSLQLYFRALGECSFGGE